MQSLALLLLLLAAASPPQPIERTPTPSGFPISEAVVIPAGAERILFSGVVPHAVVENGDPADVATFGDTETQTVSVLQGIGERLERQGLGFGDVVKMQVFLVPDPETGDMDFAGFMRGYTRFFGTEDQPHVPARSAFEVAGLAVPGWLVEIEVEAARVPATE